jgi:hypothetical protein
LDLCQELEGKSISVEANGFRGVIGARGIALEPTGAGSFRFETFMVFSNRQPFGKAEEIIDGTCHGTTLKFTRPLLDSTSQEYTGVMSKTGGAVIIDGHFWGESEGKKKRFNWSGRVQPNR